MADNLKDILSHLNPEIDQETLMLYLQGKLSAQQQHEVEKEVLQNDFETDALEGLTDFKDKKKLAILVDQLNADLRKKTEKKNTFRRKLELKISPATIIAIVIILLLAVVSFFVLSKMMHN